MPRFVLKNFSAGKNDQVWVFDKQTGKKFKSNVKNIASESGFYDVELDGVTLSMEPSLSYIETHAAAIFKRIIESESIGALSEDDRVVVSTFVAIQLLRTRHFREMYVDMSRQLDEALRSRGWDPQQIHGHKKLTEEDAKIMAIESLMSPQEYAVHILDKKWVLLKTFKGQPFCISDNPVALFNDRKSSFYGNIGIAVPGIQIYLPLSRTLSLGFWCSSLEAEARKLFSFYRVAKVMSPASLTTEMVPYSDVERLIEGLDRGTPIPSSRDNILHHNSLQVKYASRFVFSSVDDFSLAEEMIQSHPDIKHGPRMRVG